MTKPNKVIEGFDRSSISKIKATVGIWEGKDYIDIREFANTEEFKGATKKGIHFNIEDWEKFKELINRIDKEVRERSL